MAIFLKMEQRISSKNSSYGKYYTKTVPMGEVTSGDIAQSLENRSIFRAGLVEDVLNEVSKEMKSQLQQGMVVSLKGIGRFQLVAVSEGNDHPEDFDIAHDIARVDCRFLPEGHRNPFDGTITRTLTEGVKAKWAPPYDKE
jgi:predicted histone-like DNA-binding protein